MPWSESSDTSSSDDRSSSNNSSSSSSTKGTSEGTKSAELSPSDGCSGKSGRAFYAQIRVLLALNVSTDDNEAMSALESQVGAAAVSAYSLYHAVDCICNGTS
jgi:hypothetical protein